MSRSVSRSPRRFSASPSRRSDSRDRDRDKEDRIRCTVGRINVDRGFGFLRVDDSSEEIFFHSNDIDSEIDIRKLREGDEVECTTQESKKRREAREATKVWVLTENVDDREEIGRRPSPGRRRRRDSMSRSPRRRYRSRSRDRRYRSRSPRRRSPRRSRYSRSRSPRRNDSVEKGYVLRINERGFGFLAPEDTDEELFFHTHHLESGLDIRQLRRDDRVEFTTCESQKFPGKREARRVWCKNGSEVRRREMRGRRPSPRRDRSQHRGRSRSY